MKFNEWIEKFISKNKIDKLEVLKIEKDFNIYYFTIEQIVGFLKIIEPQEQQEIKKMLEEKNVNWEDLDIKYQRGSCAIKTEDGWIIDNKIPDFRINREYIRKLIDFN